jgi:hypothetical protein
LRDLPKNCVWILGECGAGRKCGEIEKAAPVEWKIRYLTIVDDRSDCGGFSFENRCCGLNDDILCGTPDSESDVDLSAVTE